METGGMTPKGAVQHYTYAPKQRELDAKHAAQVINFWRSYAIENMKRALRAEAALAQHEGPIQ